MRKWKLLGFAGLIGIALVGPGLNARALHKDAPGKSPRLSVVVAPAVSACLSGNPYS